MKWFGRPWGAPVCQDAEDWVETPTGTECSRCSRRIRSEERGVRIPHIEAFDKPWADTWATFHLDCYLDSLSPPEERAS